jgi:predicted SAM-dependent methyltransferase
MLAKAVTAARKCVRAARKCVGVARRYAAVARQYAAIQAGIARNRDLRIVIGASHTRFPGWISTEYPLFDITRRDSVTRFFEPHSVSSILAEHVWEHLTDEQAALATENCAFLLKPGGRLRIAVPDGMHPDRSYIDAVKPGGTGLGSDDHKILHTHATLAGLMKSAGFSVTLLEWFDHDGFHFAEWKDEDGYISRSSKNDERNRVRPLSYTSLIADGFRL